VVITLDRGNGKNLVSHLEPKTGNPVLWTEGDDVYLLYSMFKDKDELGNYPVRPVDRWKFCSLHVAKLTVVDNSIVMEDLGEVEGGFGLLGRCQPVEFGGNMLVPLYREKDPRCEIWVSKSGKLTRFSVFGEITKDWLSKSGIECGHLGFGVAIQPTLYISENTGLVAFCRNTTCNIHNAWKFSSSDGGKSWSDIKKSPFFNRNSSLVAVNNEDKKYRYIIINKNHDRDSLVMINNNNLMYELGVPTNNSGRKSYSYPNYTWINDILHVVHSNNHMIVHHSFDKQILDVIYEPN
jgi:hypothetical protein